jgi:hypothetical protein
VDLLIEDNGCGMNKKELRQAMVWGVKQTDEKDRLGYFGLGLKLASLSQADSVHVVSVKDNKTFGRAWTDEGLKAGFDCDILNNKEIDEITRFSTSFNEKKNGTLVYWQHLFRFVNHFSESEKLCSGLLTRLLSYTGLHLHRLLENRTITLDVYNEKSEESGIEREVKIIDPFGYKKSGAQEYPLDFYPEAQEWRNDLKIVGHIWPAKQTSKNYKLPGGANDNQGYFFYRNNRLLSKGDWYGKRIKDTHTSLARIAIDLNREVKRDKNFNVQKARINLTPEMHEAIEGSISNNGISFESYVGKAKSIYNSSKKNDPKSFPLVPGKGYPKNLTNNLQKLLDKHNTGRVRKFDFEWYDFLNDDDYEEGYFFMIDREQKIIYLNSDFRSLFMTGQKNKENDGAVLKTSLFIMLRKYLDAERLTKKSEEYLLELNEMLYYAACEDMERMDD